MACMLGLVILIHGFHDVDQFVWGLQQTVDGLTEALLDMPCLASFETLEGKT